MFKISFLSVSILLFSLANSYAQSESNDINVFYFSDTSLLKAYEELDLDVSHANLLNPQESKRNK